MFNRTKVNLVSRPFTHTAFANFSGREGTVPYTAFFYYYYHYIQANHPLGRFGFCLCQQELSRDDLPGPANAEGQ